MLLSIRKILVRREVMKKRSYPVDIYRTCALLIVIIYHIWVLTGSIPFKWEGITQIISLGGEIGVTAFFVLSGYGIYCSLCNQYEKGFSYKEYIKRRCIRIMPQYYFSLLVSILLLDGISYGLKNIVTHIFFIHNFFPECHGGINGVLWTMGVIIQFYIIAPLLFKGYKKMGLFFGILCVAFTICIKMFIYSYVLFYFGKTGSLNFMSGRQLFSAMDNFTAGMTVAYLVKNKQISLHKKISCIGILVSFIAIYFVCKLGIKYGIHTNNLSGYTWHSFLALALGGVLLFFASGFKCNSNSFGVRLLLWISRYEYGIYIWHLLIILNILNRSNIIKNIIASRYVLMLYPIFIILSVLSGALFTIMVDLFVQHVSSIQKVKYNRK